MSDIVEKYLLTMQYTSVYNSVGYIFNESHKYLIWCIV